MIHLTYLRVTFQDNVSIRIVFVFETQSQHCIFKLFKKCDYGHENKKRQFVFQLRVISFTHVLQASHILKSSVFSTLVAFLLKSDGPRHFGEF